MSDMSTLRQVLADHIESLLTAVDSAYSGQVSQYYRSEVDNMPTNRRIYAVMDNPVRYAEVIHLQDSDGDGYFSDEETATGALMSVSQAFRVSVWRQYKDAGTLASSSTNAWDALVWDSPGGLLHKLRTGDMVITSGGATYYHSQPTPGQDAILPITSDGLQAHYVEFTIELTA